MHAFGLASEFVKVCPEDVWGRKFGGWPVWQQLFHSFASLDFFLRPAGAGEEPPLFEAGVAELKKTPAETPAKQVLQDFITKAQAKVSGYVAGLDDAALSQKNEGLSARFDRDVTHAFTLSLIASHTMYHLGACDAALRESGKPGVF